MSATETDARELEGALSEDWCHTDDGREVGVAICGASCGDEPVHDGKVVGGVCSGCGRRACPDCLDADRDKLADWGWSR